MAPRGDLSHLRGDPRRPRRRTRDGDPRPALRRGEWSGYLVPRQSAFGGLSRCGRGDGARPLPRRLDAHRSGDPPHRLALRRPPLRRDAADVATAADPARRTRGAPGLVGALLRHHRSGQSSVQAARRLALVRRLPDRIRRRRRTGRLETRAGENVARRPARPSRRCRSDRARPRARRGNAAMNRFLPLTLLVAVACTRFPGRPPADSQAVRPDAVTAFEPLYRANCAGCHGENGRGGAAAALADPLYLAIADDATIRRVVKSGVPGTAMPAFAREAGGMLTQQQVDAIVAGMRERWARPEAVGDVLTPPYSAPGEGDRKRGAAVYQTYCASHHGHRGPSGSGRARLPRQPAGTRHVVG